MGSYVPSRRIMIGIFDSGTGGLSVYREIKKLLPAEDYFYLADNAYCPYGTKDASVILDRAREITDFLLFKGADIIVIACNTATAAAIAALREEYSEPSERVKMLTGGRRDHVKFIGMEPAVKPAALGTKTGVIGVLATEGTLKASKYLHTKGQYEEEVKIVEHVGEGFVELVEKNELSGPKAEAVVSASLQPLLDAGADKIVLGCTHYPFLEPLIRGMVPEDVEIINPAPAVAKQLLKVIREENLPLKDSASQGTTTLKATGDDTNLIKLFNTL